MKTTVEISDDLIERAKRVQREQDVTLRSLVEDGLRLALQRFEQRAESKPFELPVFHGSGLSDEAKEKGWRWIIEHANDRDAP